MSALLCDGPYNGRWVDVHVDMSGEFPDIDFWVNDQLYRLTVWPNGDIVGLWIPPDWMDVEINWDWPESSASSAEENGPQDAG